MSLRRALTFAAIFLALAIAGTLAQRFLGSAGFLAISVAGGLVSSGNTTSTATMLAAAGQIDGRVGDGDNWIGPVSDREFRLMAKSSIGAS